MIVKIIFYLRFILKLKPEKSEACVVTEVYKDNKGMSFKKYKNIFSWKIVKKMYNFFVLRALSFYKINICSSYNALF